MRYIAVALSLSIACVATFTSAQPVSHHGAEAHPRGQKFYRYKKAGGREVYTNATEQVPLDQRAGAELDLSRISLNTEIGRQIAERLQREHAALTHTPYCEQARAAAERPFLNQLFDQYGPLVCAAAVLLLLLVVSPAAMRRFGIAGWSKALGLAIPATFAVGLLSFSLDRTQAAIAQLHKRAQPCEPGALAALGAEPGVLQKHAELVESLRRDMAQIDAESGNLRASQARKN